MIQNLQHNLFNFNNSKKQYGLKPTDEINAIRAKLAAGIKVDDLSKEEYLALSTFEKADMAKFSQEVNAEISKAQQLATKLAKGEKLTAEEERLLNESYPDLKRDAEQAKKEGKELKEKLKNCKTPAERQQVLSSAITMVSNLANKGVGANIQVALKLSAIEKAKEESDKENNETIPLSIQNNKFNSGLLFNKLT